MDTKVARIDPSNIDMAAIDAAALLIRAGELVAFPTETVYGLGGDGLSIDAQAAIYAAKGRPLDNPLILHVSDFDMPHRLAHVSKNAEAVMRAFWPGPLTLTLPKREVLPDSLTCGLNSIALRLPQNPIARALIAAAKTPIAAPSANTSGRPSPTLAAHVLEDLGGIIPMILDGGACEVGVESTVLDLSSETPVILRPGAVTHEMLTEILGDVEIFGDAVLAEADKPASPGMKYKHYAPRAAVTLVVGQANEVTRKINELAAGATGKMAILATAQTAGCYSGYEVKVLGDRDKPETICTNLFAVLRECDTLGVDQIFAEGIKEDGVGVAIMNRLKKAAGYNILQA